MKPTPAPAQLSWTTQDGGQCTVGFSPDMASVHGHRRASGGGLAEVRGELVERREYSLWAGGTRGHEFITEVEDTGRWSSAGVLRVLIDDGSESPVRWASWCDKSGNTWSVALHAERPSGNEDVSDLVSGVRASAEHSRAGEVAGNLLDPKAGKWFAPQRTAVLEFRLTQPIEVDRYLLTSANDAPDRDPAAWTLSGSTDGNAWRTVDVRSGESFTARHQPKSYLIAEPGAYDRYRLEITGNNGSPHLQLEAIRFLVDGGGGFVGYRQRAGYGLYPYRGTRRARPQVLLPQPQPRRMAEWEGWQPGGSWLPLGGSLSSQSLTSPSGRFTALHAVYDPSFSVWDNATHEPVWISDAPAASLLCLGPDGELAAWNHRGERVWSANTSWRGVRRLEMRDTGELALTDADGGVVWSSGIPQVTAVAQASGLAVARGSTMRRGESLHGQSLTSADGSTVLYHDGRRIGISLQDVSKGSPRWSRPHYQQPNVLALEEDGFLRVRALDGTELEQFAGLGAELVVVRDAAVLRDDAGVIMWSTAGSRSAPVREPALPQNADLAAWFAALVGPGRGYCIAVVKGATPHEVLERAGITPESVVTATWHQLRQQRDTAHPHEGKLVAAIAAGPDVLVVSDDADLPAAELAPKTSVAALHLPVGGNGYGTTFSFHRDGRLLSEIRDEPRRRKGVKVPEVAAAIGEIPHHLDRHVLVFRTSGVVPSAAALGGLLLGGVLVPRPTPVATPDTEDGLPRLVIGSRDELSPLVIRTDFTDEEAWNRVLVELQEPWMENETEPYLISEPAYDGAPAEQIIKAVLAATSELELPGVVFIADATTMHEEKYPLLAVSTEWNGEPFATDEEAFTTQLRIRPNAAIEVSCNLGMGNMDFEDFAGDGVSERMVD